MISIAEKIQLGKILVSDGALGTFLIDKGLSPGECPEYWNIQKPDEVYDIAKSYIDAGSDMIETNSFGSNSFKLMPYLLSDKVYEINIKNMATKKRQGKGHFRNIQDG
jgi:5-methyltetrahydrofolate--homocysteine methyltransferase